MQRAQFIKTKYVSELQGLHWSEQKQFLLQQNWVCFYKLWTLRSFKKHLGSLKLFSRCQNLFIQNAALYMTLACAPRSYLSETLFTLFSNESNVQKVYTCFVSMNTWHRMCRVRCIYAVQRASSKLSITAGWPSLWNHSLQSVKLLLENLPKTRH